MKKKIVGYTTGVFDMFHIGHLHLIKKAKRHCDYLIVGISSDDLVERYKGKIPIIPFEHRFEIISSLSYVDEVVVQSNRDKMQQYYDIAYDWMFVGDDWKGTDLFNDVEKKLEKYGASIIYFKYTKNISSTKFTNILQNIYNSEKLVK